MCTYTTQYIAWLLFWLGTSQLVWECRRCVVCTLHTAQHGSSSGSVHHNWFEYVAAVYTTQQGSSSFRTALRPICWDPQGPQWLCTQDDSPMFSWAACNHGTAHACVGTGLHGKGDLSSLADFKKRFTHSTHMWGGRHHVWLRRSINCH